MDTTSCMGARTSGPHTSARKAHLGVSPTATVEVSDPCVNTFWVMLTSNLGACADARARLLSPCESLRAYMIWNIVEVASYCLVPRICILSVPRAWLLCKGFAHRSDDASRTWLSEQNIANASNKLNSPICGTDYTLLAIRFLTNIRLSNSFGHCRGSAAMVLQQVQRLGHHKRNQAKWGTVPLSHCDIKHAAFRLSLRWKIPICLLRELVFSGTQNCPVHVRWDTYFAWDS